MFDLETLLAPIPGASPCGEDMLFSAQFDQIQRAREHDDPSLEQGEWVTDLKEADWPFVVAESMRLLSESTKDLRLAAWLTDAMGTTRGFAGLADGYRLLTGLCERYWESVHPLPEHGDFDIRTGNITWLLQRTNDLLKRTPIVNDSHTSYDMLTLETALALNHQIKRDPEQADELRHGKISLEQFELVRHATARQFMIDLHTELLDCEEAILGFESVFDAKVNANGPSFSPLKETLAGIRHATERFAKEAGIQWGDAEEAAAPDEGSDAADAAPPGATARAGVHSRAQAIAQLKQVADYFESTEPASPVAYLAKKAARWADMPLHAWLRNVIKNEQELAQLEEMLGVLEKGEKGGNPS
jgi:type VI secretion system protein ImpA